MVEILDPWGLPVGVWLTDLIAMYSMAASNNVRTDPHCVNFASVDRPHVVSADSRNRHWCMVCWYSVVDLR